MSFEAFTAALADAVQMDRMPVEIAAGRCADVLGHPPTIREIQAAMRARPDVFPPQIDYKRLTR